MNNAVLQNFVFSSEVFSWQNVGSASTHGGGKGGGIGGDGGKAGGIGGGGKGGGIGGGYGGDAGEKAGGGDEGGDSLHTAASSRLRYALSAVTFGSSRIVMGFSIDGSVAIRRSVSLLTSSPKPHANTVAGRSLTR